MKLQQPQFDGKVSLERSIKNRRTSRAFMSDPLSQGEFSQLLWAAYGVTEERGFKRSAPSGGALSTPCPSGRMTETTALPQGSGRPTAAARLSPAAGTLVTASTVTASTPPLRSNTAVASSRRFRERTRRGSTSSRPLMLTATRSPHAVGPAWMWHSTNDTVGSGLLPARASIRGL